jgi:hypothetical protein
MSVDECGFDGKRTTLVMGVSDSAKELRIDVIARFYKLTL